MKQYTDQWWSARRGKFTASQVWRLFSTDERHFYIVEVAEERIGIYSPYKEVSFAGAWGHNYEPIARRLFQKAIKEEIKEVGFLEPEDKRLRGWFGASPDGVGNGFGVEIKCLSLKAHEEFLRRGIISPRHSVQIAAQFLVTDVPVWYYVSYHPRGTPPLAYTMIDGRHSLPMIETVRDEVLKAIEDAKEEIRKWGGEV